MNVNDAVVLAGASGGLGRAVLPDGRLGQRR
jgi:hypothetical protein